ncbi:hydrogenase-4 component B [Mesocricetibacter intestinalis]|uniref:Hydrogenase-4 component B n=1 Tax=Mesocricetibacter intestinalis TaxID=1521930 RepID=A0A4R6VAQ5_9PAST|nr:hydrogenase 4 subunit B [Mesocricetibacter intestinalis]TDQ56997.1 hydrogenase-4 component B [Mesocricetibacter intestinalis]
MSVIHLLITSLLVYVVGAFISLCISKNEQLSINISGVTGIVGGALGIIACAPVLISSETAFALFQTPFDFAAFSIRVDGLAAFMVCVISLLVIVTSLYSFSYVREYQGKGAGSMGFFMNLFIASMIALVTSDNAFYFLVFFEMMSLASYFLVLTEQDDEATNAGLLYFFIAHAGSVLIMIAFFIFYCYAGSFEFADFRQTQLSSPLAFTVFILAFLGFGAKAGMIPLHGWLPKAHPAAPSHASAMMSGVMVKIGIFGIIKVGIDLLGANNMWFGVIVLGFGAVSSVLGVLYALAEHDIKRLLAYHTVENIGIIMMGVGVGMIGIAIGNPVLATVGLLGGLYHLLNHAVFKGLLFLGAGSVMYRLHTKDMDLMGGLGKLMPYTALCFLIGTMAISALPPFNGFVSEWFTYQSLFTLSQNGDLVLKVAGPVAIIMLALTGALAALCFVKVYGISFGGAPRSEKAANAREVPKPMLFAMGILALCCILLGVGASVITPIIAKISVALSGLNAFPLAENGLVVSTSEPHTALSTPMVSIMLIAFFLVPFAYYGVTKKSRMADAAKGNPWACGYAYEAYMATSAGGFTRALRTMFKPLYTIRKTFDPAPLSYKGIDAAIKGSTKAEPFWEEKVTMPLARFIPWFSARLEWLQGGDFRVYCVYFVITLVLLLAAATMM